MKRRGFLSFVLGAPVGVVAAVGASSAVAEKVAVATGPLVAHPFHAGTALRDACPADLSECSVENAVVLLVQDAMPLRLPLIFTLVVPRQLMFEAARMCKTVEELRKGLPENMPPLAYPRIDYRIDDGMLDRYEWGVVALNGRCFYSPGC